MTPLLIGLGALLLLGAGKAPAKRPRLPGPMPKLVLPGSTLATPKSAPKSVDVKIGPIKILKQTPTKVTTPATIDTPLAQSPSQGGSPSLDTPLSADIPHDEISPSAPGSASTSSTPRPGFNPDSARKAAASTANNLRRGGKAGYSRPLLKQWQTHAGLTADGLYGPATRGALVYFGVKDPPAAFTGTGTVPYRPDYLFPLNYTPKG